MWWVSKTSQKIQNNQKWKKDHVKAPKMCGPNTREGPWRALVGITTISYRFTAYRRTSIKGPEKIYHKSIHSFCHTSTSRGRTLLPSILLFPTKVKSVTHDTSRFLQFTIKIKTWSKPDKYSSSLLSETKEQTRTASSYFFSFSFFRMLAFKMAISSSEMSCTPLLGLRPSCMIFYHTRRACHHGDLAKARPLGVYNFKFVAPIA